MASRIEVKVTCDGQLHHGYVPVFQKFSKPISVLNLYRSELTSIGNGTFKELTYVRVSWTLDTMMCCDIEPLIQMFMQLYISVLYNVH